jgi:hypothetical protein
MNIIEIDWDTRYQYTCSSQSLWYNKIKLNKLYLKLMKTQKS